MTEQPTMNEPAASPRPPRTTWAADAACVLALLSALPSFFWAAGGTSGLATVGGVIEELARARDPAGVALGVGAGVVKVAGAVLALVLVPPGAVGCPAGWWVGLPGTTVANPAIGERDEPASDQGSAQNFWLPA